MMVLIVMVLAGGIVGWCSRVLWEGRHPRYLIVPDLREDSDNTAALQRAIDLAAGLKGRQSIVDVRAGTFPTGSVEFRGAQAKGPR